MRISAAVLLLTLPAAASAAGEGDEYQFERRSRRDHRRDMEVEAIVVPASNPAASVAVAASAAAAGGLDLEIDNLNMGDGTTRATTLLRPIQVWADGCTIEDAEGTVTPCDNGNVILVSNDDEQDLVVLTSNPTTGETSGFVSSSGATYGVSQMQGGYTKAEPPTGTAAIPENWSCHMDAPPENRRLLAEGLPGHDHHAHDHHDHDHHAHDHDHFNLDNLNEAFEKEGIRLRGSSKEDRPGRKLLYYTDDFPKKYSYQVDVFIEYDSQLVANNGGTTAGVQQYIADLMAGANIIYEKEIDTHLEVSGMLQTNRYDSSGNTSQALNVLRNARMGSNFPSGANLVHALLGRQLGGGIAYLNALCNTNIAFGVSAGIVGSYDIGTPDGMVWDIVVFTHEIGHNFGTGHTHDYSPQVDTCGNSQCGGLPNNDAATIMSYCHLCSGGTNNVAPSFGGHREVAAGGTSGTWIDDPLVASKGFSTDPRRVAQTMKNFVAGRGTCVDPQGTVPNQQAECTTAGDCNDSNACTVDTCDTSGSGVGGVCVHVDTCASEAPSAAPTCGGDKIVVNILTDNYPGETTWTLENTCTNTQVMSGGPYSQGGTEFSQESCADTGKYRFTINDAYGDGVCCGYGQGAYEITMAGSVVAAGGQFGSSEVKEFGSCDTPSPPTLAPTVTASNAPSVTASSAPSVAASGAPSVTSSSAPSVTASDAPSVTASSAPSVAASGAPSVTSSSAPSVTASDAPSVKASAAPSILASDVPSVTSSSAPSVTASGAPSVKASAAPSILASDVPSVTSSAAPSVTASGAPSVKASAAPSVTGSVAPSVAPPPPPPPPDSSSAPSVTSSSAPSVLASGAPSVTSSSAPSVLASGAPSVTSSSAPSVLASSAPSVTSSSAPSVLASSAPSVTSSSAPSVLSSGAPSVTSSSAPSVLASSAPSRTPTTPPPTDPPPSCIDVTISILSDNYPGETTWNLKDSAGVTVMSGGPYGQRATTFTETACLVESPHTFTIEDAYGDGICCGYGQGAWSITLTDSGTELGSGGQFGSEETFAFTPAPPTDQPTDVPTTSPTVAPTVITEAPSAAPSAAPTKSPTESPTVSPPPPPPGPACTDVSVSILTDNYPGETRWNVKDAAGSTVMNGGPYSQRSTTFTETECLSDGAHTFTITDAYGDGICCSYGQGSWSVTLPASGTQLGNGGQFNREEELTFTLGNAPPPSALGTFKLALKTDNYPGETTWQIASVTTGDIVERGGPYGTRGASINIEEQYAGNDCYKFYIYDSYGDGICCSYGSGNASISWNGDVVGSAGAFGREWASNKFGDSTVCASVAGMVAPPEALVGETTNMTPAEKKANQNS